MMVGIVHGSETVIGLTMMVMLLKWLGSHGALPLIPSLSPLSFLIPSELSRYGEGMYMFVSFVCLVDPPS